MASEKGMYWLAVVVLGVGLFIRFANDGQPWVQYQAARLAQRAGQTALCVRGYAQNAGLLPDERQTDADVQEVAVVRPEVRLVCMRSEVVRRNIQIKRANAALARVNKRIAHLQVEGQ